MRTLTETTTKLYLSLDDNEKLRKELHWTFLGTSQFGEYIFSTETETEIVYITKSEVRKFDLDRLIPLHTDEILVLAEILNQEGNISYIDGAKRNV